MFLTFSFFLNSESATREISDNSNLAPGKILCEVRNFFLFCFVTPPPLFWGWILLLLRSPKGGCCSIGDGLSCSCVENTPRFILLFGVLAPNLQQSFICYSRISGTPIQVLLLYLIVRLLCRDTFKQYLSFHIRYKLHIFSSKYVCCIKRRDWKPRCAISHSWFLMDGHCCFW